MSLFRPEAVDAKRQRLWGEVHIAQPPSLTIWTGIVAALCAAVLLGLIFGRYTRKETVAGFLEAQAGVVDVRPIQEGRIARVLVQEGQVVAQGDPLVEFTSDLGALGNGPVLDVKLAQTERQLDALSRRRSAVQQSYFAENRRLNEQVVAQQRLKSILVEQRQGRANALALAEADLERLVRLQAQGFAPGVEVDRRRRAVLAEQDAVRGFDADIARADARIADLQSLIAGTPSREAEVQAALAAEVARLEQQRADLQVARGYVMRAPVAGTISRLIARDGYTPPNNGPLLSITPLGSTLRARLLVPTRAIGFLRVGQPANIQVEAFPFQRFGMLKGYISAIHPLVVRPGELTFPIDYTEPVYEIEVAVPRSYVIAYGERRELRSGMVLRADLPIDRRRLWQQLFDPLLAAERRNIG